MQTPHVIYEDGAWNLWLDGRVVARCHSREECWELWEQEKKETLDVMRAGRAPKSGGN